MPNSNEPRRFLIPLIVVGIVVWGGLLALGAFLFERQFDLRKPLIILGCVTFFLAIWGTALWANWGRLHSDSMRRKKSNAPADDDLG